jgi:Transposase DDE domain group 1
MPAEVDLTLPLPGLSPVCGKRVVARFDGGRLSSDGGILLLAEVERRLGIAERLARCVEDPRAADRIVHGLAEMIRFRALAIAAGYPDANDCDLLRKDPAFKMAVGRLPETGGDLCSQPTMTRLENLPGPVACKRMMAAMVELFCDSFDTVPRRIVLDIDDTEDRAYGQQQLSLFNAHHDGRCFMPIHIYEATTGKPVAIFLRPGKTPDGIEVAMVLRHVVRAIRARWPRIEILIRGDSHYGRPEAMAWCERHRVGYIFGLAGNQVLLRRVTAEAERVALDRLDAPADSKVRRYAEFRYSAKTWKTERRVIARVEASGQGVDSRFIVTNLAGLPKSLYEKVYCARGQAENLIKAHKLHLASDRTSCTKATANQFRLLIHTAAYWLMHSLRGLAPKSSFWRDAQFDTLRLGLIKVAVRVTELVTKIKVSLPTGFPYQQGFSSLAGRLAKLPP